MASVFPSEEWLKDLMDYLNSHEKYGQVAKNWEGDLVFDLLPEGALQQRTKIYLDLWHGKCRGAQFLPVDDEKEARFVMSANFSNFVRVLKGDLDPMQAMLTRKLNVKGDMAYMMRHVPVVLLFVRCAQDVTEKILGE